GSLNSAAGSACSSRSTSPSSSAHSLIPTARTGGGPHEKHIPNTSATTSPSSPRSSAQLRAGSEKNSVLGSLKLFSYKEKSSGGRVKGGTFQNARIFH
ncbi:hypothetical protein C0J52_19908, partial [Blattella germanica]